MPDFARPRTVEEATRLLAGGGWRPLAGGTDLYPGAGAGLAGRVLDLTGLKELTEITLGDDLRIGAAVSWSTIAESDLPSGLRALQQAARVIGGRQVQNAGTIGGNLCNASPAADGVPPLLACGALVELLSASGRRRLPLAEFLLGPRRTGLAPDEVMAAVILPRAGQAGRSAFAKLGARSHLVISIAMVAARIVVEAGRITDASVAVGACSPVALRLARVEAALLGAPLGLALTRITADDVVAPLAPIDDVRATAAYRRAVALELVHRAVAEALAGSAP